MAHEIGATIWFRGDECTVSTAPYELFGSMWQDATRNEDGKVVTIKTPECVDAEAAAKQREWHEQQAAFRRLRA